MGYKIVEDGNLCKIAVDHCTAVNDDGICIQYENNYKVSNNICHRNIENCEVYEGEKCKKCKEGYGFEEDDRLNCININKFEEYYSRDNISYLKCDGEGEGRIKNCRKCKYEDKLICNECKTNYILKDAENNKCYSKEIITEEYYYIDEFHIRLCSKGINNCKECDKEGNDLWCTKCDNDNNYYLVNEDYHNFKQKSEIIPFDEYYLNSEKDHYYSYNYNSIDNCKKCLEKNTCFLCQEGYTFVDDNKEQCKNKNDLGREYIQDINDTTIYRKCNYYIDNCNTCSSKDECLSCINHYGLYNDKTKCIDDMNEAYYKDESDNLYYLCSEAIQNFIKCSSSTIFNNCINGYIRINNDKINCIKSEGFNTSEYYEDPNDNNMYIKCSSSISNCHSCENENKCTYCNPGYLLINDDYTQCFNKSNISISTFFTEDDIMYYSCNENRY